MLFQTVCVEIAVSLTLVHKFAYADYVTGDDSGIGREASLRSNPS